MFVCVDGAFDHANVHVGGCNVSTLCATDQTTSDDAFCRRQFSRRAYVPTTGTHSTNKCAVNTSDKSIKRQVIAACLMTTDDRDKN